MITLADLHGQGADIIARDDEGNSPMDIVVQWGHLDVVKYLQGQGVDIHAMGDDGFSATHLAAQHGQLHVLKYLHDQGADILAKSDLFLSPLLLEHYPSQVSICMDDPPQLQPSCEFPAVAFIFLQLILIITNYS